MTAQGQQDALGDVTRDGSIAPKAVLAEANKSRLARKSASAQITVHCTPEELAGRQVAAVVNFPPRQIGKFISEVLTVGFPDQNSTVVLYDCWATKSGCSPITQTTPPAALFD